MTNLPADIRRPPQKHTYEECPGQACRTNPPRHRSLPECKQGSERERTQNAHCDNRRFRGVLVRFDRAFAHPDEIFYSFLSRLTGQIYATCDQCERYDKNKGEPDGDGFAKDESSRKGNQREQYSNDRNVTQQKVNVYEAHLVFGLDPLDVAAGGMISIGHTPSRTTLPVTLPSSNRVSKW